MHIVQYICTSPDALAAVIALAELQGMEFKVTAPVVALQVDNDETLAVLRRTFPGPSSVEEI